MNRMPELPLCPPDEPEIPDQWLERAAAELLEDYKRQLEDGSLTDEIEERATQLMEDAAESAAEDRAERIAEDRARDRAEWSDRYGADRDNRGY